MSRRVGVQGRAVLALAAWDRWVELADSDDIAELAGAMNDLRDAIGYARGGPQRRRDRRGAHAAAVRAAARRLQAEL